MNYQRLDNLFAKVKAPWFTNSVWGVVSNLFQNILLSIFFIVIARQFSTQDFAAYIIANTIYSLIVAFSSLGLGQWFIREYLNIEDKTQLTGRFLKMQFFIGVIFYVINIFISYCLYSNQLIRNLSLLIGINIIFDNIIYVIKNLNIARLEQKKTFIILTVEAFLKFLLACMLFISPISVLALSLILILLRALTLNLFIRIGTGGVINFKQVMLAKTDTSEIKRTIISNWPFIIIGTISIIYWRIGNIMVSKMLSFTDVANYEISFKLFSIAEILPFIVSSSIFPLLVQEKNVDEKIMYSIFRKAFIGYGVYGVFVFTLVYSFADVVIPFLFGAKYDLVSVYCKEMFMTILVFPTALLQANLLIAMKLEKLDMKFNMVSLLINVLISVIGLLWFKTLSAVNYAIFFSFLIFHVCQDIFLVKKKIVQFNHAILFYLFTGTIILIYILLAAHYSRYFLFVVFWIVVLFSGLIYARFFYERNNTLPVSGEILSH